MIVGRDGDHRHVLVDERDRAVLHLAGRIAFGVDVGDFLELQRAFERDRIVDAAAEVQEVGAVVELRRDLLDLLRGLQRVFEDLRQLHQRVDVLAALRRRQRAAHFGELQREEVERDQLRGERLGRGHANLRAGVRVDRAFGLARRHAADDVADGEAAGALALGFAQRRQRVGGFARLRDGDGERLVVDDRIAIAVFGAVVHFDRQLRELLDHELADERGVPRGAAGEQRDLVDRLADRRRRSPSRSRYTCPVSSEARPSTVSRTACGCSKISLSMKCL